MNIREQIKNDFDIDLPIKGGTGGSIENPVILAKEWAHMDYVNIEHVYLKCIGIGRGIKWRTISQEVMIHNGRTVDKIRIETEETTETEIITQTEAYYFDITECMDLAGNTL